MKKIKTNRNSKVCKRHQNPIGHSRLEPDVYALLYWKEKPHEHKFLHQRSIDTDDRVCRIRYQGVSQKLNTPPHSRTFRKIFLGLFRFFYNETLLPSHMKREIHKRIYS